MNKRVYFQTIARRVFMKRAGYYAGAVGLLLIIGVLILVCYESQKPDFEIQSTLKNTFDNYETVDLSVIVHARNDEPEKLMEKVKEYYTSLNGMPDKLSIKLYADKRAYASGTVFLQKMYMKEK